MITGFLKRKFDAMGRSFDYDVSYMHELADADAEAVRKFALAMPFFQQQPKVPKNAYWAVKLRACMHADCGACLRLVIEMAKRSGIDPTVTRDILIATPADSEAALGQAYADAVLKNTADLAGLVAEIEAKWGKKGLASVSTAIVSGQFFPLFKRGFGHGNVCEPVLRELEMEQAA